MANRGTIAIPLTVSAAGIGAKINDHTVTADDIVALLVSTVEEEAKRLPAMFAPWSNELKLKALRRAIVAIEEERTNIWRENQKVTPINDSVQQS